MASGAFQIFRERIAEADIPSYLALQAQFTEASPVPTFLLEGAYYGNDGIVGLNKTVQPLWDALVTLNDSVQAVMILEDLNWIRACRYAGTLIGLHHQSCLSSATLRLASSRRLIVMSVLHRWQRAVS